MTTEGKSLRHMAAGDRLQDPPKLHVLYKSQPECFVPSRHVSDCPALTRSPQNFNSDSNTSRFTQQKALAMSKNNPLTPILLRRTHVTSCMKCYIDGSCINWKDIDGVKKSITLLYIIFPKRLENSANILPPSLYLPYFIRILLLKESDWRITALSWHLQNSFLLSTGLQIGLHECELKKSTLTLGYTNLHLIPLLV